MPRFVRELPENGKEILCMEEVLQYLLNNSKPLIEKSELENMVKMTQYEWQSYADEIKVSIKMTKVLRNYYISFKIYKIRLANIHTIAKKY